MKLWVAFGMCVTGADCGVVGLPIQPLLRDGHFAPEEIGMLVTAFEDILRDLRLVDRNDPAVALVAKRVIELARQGERDPATLRADVLKSFKSDPGVSGL
jgi:hypothetical protein